MAVLEQNSAEIWSLWEVCQRVYLRHGWKLQFPEHTNPKKTYQWRYLKLLLEKFQEWEFDNQTIEKFIDVAVCHVKEKGILRKGLTALHQKNLMELCYKTLQLEEEKKNQQLESLLVTKRWLIQQIGSKNVQNVLLYRQSFDSLTNLALWHQSRKISLLYIAISKSCYKALLTLERQDADDLFLLPKSADLYWIYKEFVAQKQNKTQAKEILKNDWRELCL
jgi:hypothetical protein